MNKEIEWVYSAIEEFAKIGDVIFRGEQNHAGTTYMTDRKDPLIEASKFMLEMENWALQHDNKMVFTTGNVKVLPGRNNVIPGEVILSFDTRSSNLDLIEETLAKMESYESELKDGVTMEIALQLRHLPVQMNPTGINLLQNISEKNNFEYVHMHSGAGHDAQTIAKKVASNMIFVPSKNGISHAPEEYTSIDDALPGYLLLKEYIQTLAWQNK